jgi:hypothetical protein
MLRKVPWWIPAIIVVLSLSLVAVACGDDGDGSGDDEATRQELVDLITTLASTNGSEATQEEIDFYLAHVTDSFVQEFGTESLDACRENAAECIGEPLTNPTVDPTSVEVKGDTATVLISADEASFGVEVIRQGDVWKADGLFVSDDEIPEGTEVIDFGLTEFAFAADLTTDVVKGGDFALHVRNGGEQVHEVTLVSLGTDTRPLEEILQDESFEPQPVFVKFPYAPGDESDVALPEPLEAGRYVFVCFLPDTDDPEMTPHAFKGMSSEFTVE